ncbi:hypothetical protein BGE01nite_55950 [Brevifollis gellanilyticus]|uniref:Uncharacterized protein n=1 Tax=Brevifollis gellanilyticus TaxID=748831 RepID=A0A512MHU7_9BACT|nr:hypothetical protein BGE01nite_55950 [Brevifollis gellanilyticus]
MGFFYDALDPYGDWVYTPNYGYIWQPVASRQPDWAPYSDGYWAYTDAGWTWISDEDFGWATYHYGRWARLNSRWSWIPGYEWAPAWVSWRQNDNHVGWAPLPPEARWYANTGFSSWTDSYYDVGPSYYNFVPVNRFASQGSLRPYIVDRSRNVTYIDNSVNVTNITYRNNVVNNIFVGGPDPSRLERLGGSPIRRLNLRRDDDGFRRDWVDGRGDGRDFRDRRPGDFRNLSRIENDNLLVAAPSVRRDDSPSQPRRVRDNIERPEVDRGWRDVGDSKLAERLRERNREELQKISPDKMPEKTPLVVSGQTPPKELDRTPGEGRLGSAGRPGDPRGARDEEVRKGLPPMADRNVPGRVQDQPPGDSKKGRDGVADRKGPDGVDRKGLPDPTDRKGLPDGVDRKGPPGREGGPLDRRGLPEGVDRKGGAPAPDMDRDRAKGLPGREGGPLDRRGPDGIMPDRKGPPDRDGQPKRDREGRPDVNPRVLPDQTPGMPSRPKAGPTTPEETPPRRVAPPDSPAPGGSIMPERKKGPPKAGPDMPEPKGETRRALPNPIPEAKPRVAPMPTPDVTPKTAPMPKPEPRRAEPRPMPQPKQNPSAVPQPRKEMPRTPEIRSQAPSKARPLPTPQARPAPQVRSSPPPQARPAPAPRPVPQVSRPAPAPRPTPQARPAPAPRPAPQAARPAPAPKAAGPGPQKKEKR